MTWIKLTHAVGPVWLNLDKFHEMGTTANGRTYLIGDDKEYEVTETPEQIMRMLQRPQVTFTKEQEAKP